MALTSSSSLLFPLILPLFVSQLAENTMNYALLLTSERFWHLPIIMSTGFSCYLRVWLFETTIIHLQK